MGSTVSQELYIPFISTFFIAAPMVIFPPYTEFARSKNNLIAKYRLMFFLFAFLMMPSFEGHFQFSFQLFHFEAIASQNSIFLVRVLNVLD